MNLSTEKINSVGICEVILPTNIVHDAFISIRLEHLLLPDGQKSFGLSH